MLFHQRRKAVFDDGSSRSAENVTDKKNPHVISMLTRENTSLARWSLGRLAIAHVWVFDQRSNRRTSQRLSSRNQFGCFQEVVIARRIQRQIPNTLRMHHDILEVPQVDVRQIFGQNSLDFRIDLLARVLVRVRRAPGRSAHPRADWRSRCDWRRAAKIWPSEIRIQRCQDLRCRRSNAKNELDRRRA